MKDANGTSWPLPRPVRRRWGESAYLGVVFSASYATAILLVLLAAYLQH